MNTEQHEIKQTRTFQLFNKIHNKNQYILDT